MKQAYTDGGSVCGLEVDCVWIIIFNKSEEVSGVASISASTSRYIHMYTVLVLPNIRFLLPNQA